MYDIFKHAPVFLFPYYPTSYPFSYPSKKKQLFFIHFAFSYPFQKSVVLYDDYLGI